MRHFWHFGGCPDLFYHCKRLPNSVVRCTFLAHDDWLIVHTSLGLSNDPWCLGVMGRFVLRNVPTTETMDVPVAFITRSSVHEKRVRYSNV